MVRHGARMGRRWLSGASNSKGSVRTVRARYFSGNMVAVMQSTDRSMELVQKRMSAS